MYYRGKYSMYFYGEAENLLPMAPRNYEKMQIRRTGKEGRYTKWDKQASKQANDDSGGNEHSGRQSHNTFDVGVRLNIV